MKFKVSAVGMADENFSCVKDFEEYASEHLPRDSLWFTNAGADDEVTLRDNVQAFQRWRIRPKYMVDTSKRSTRSTVLGSEVDFPIGVAPSSAQRFAHPDGDAAVARAAQDAKTIFILSTAATSSIEEIAQVAPNGCNWFQLYMPKDRRVTVNMIKRAERCGFKAVVLSIDNPVVGKRRVNIKNPLVWPKHLKMGNFGDQWDKAVNSSSGGIPSGGHFMDNMTWADLDWLKSITTLPVVIKGVMTAEDAELAIQHGAAAIYVSNHGGRQLDSCQATIDVLPEIVEAVRGRVEVYLDGGVRTGTDAFKALGLGANAVFMGRPIIWGLSYRGYEGVYRVLSIMKEELNKALALSGCTSPSSIKPSQIVRVAHSLKSKI